MSARIPPSHVGPPESQRVPPSSHQFRSIDIWWCRKTPGVLENLRFWAKRLLLLGDGLLDNLLHDLLGGLLLGGLGLLGGGLLLQMTARYAIATALLRTQVRKVMLQHRKRALGNSSLK